MSETLSDRVLVERASRGDSIAFSELVTRHYRRAVRVAFGLLRDRHDAEDVVQEAFARVYRRIADFEGHSTFQTWLYRIVVNLSIDATRRRRRERRVRDVEEDGAVERAAATVTLWPGYDDSDPRNVSERRALAERLEGALRSLPEIHQAVVVLREIEGLSYEEIAATLGIKKGTVMSRLFNARRSLQARLALPADTAAVAMPRGASKR